MGTLVTNVLAPRGLSYVYNTQVAPVLTAAKPVTGYVSWGTNDGSGQLQPDYMLNQLHFKLANGAVAETWESYNGNSFTWGNRRGQALIADWLRAGGTAGIAQVEEPGANLSNMTNESRMFQMLLDGYTWVESAWNATPQVSYVNTVVGDPLMTWRPWIPGDANLDGVVDVHDLLQLTSNWQKPGTFETGDFNGDGMVDAADLSIIGADWMKQASPPGLIPLPAAPILRIPEPSSTAVMILFAAFLAGRSRAGPRRQRPFPQ
jgi:hypothetical protein